MSMLTDASITSTADTAPASAQGSTAPASALAASTDYGTASSAAMPPRTASSPESSVREQTEAEGHDAPEQPDAQAAWNAQVEQWREEMATDPELGGDNLAATVSRAQNALRRFDTEDRFIGTLLQQSGYGNHPQIVRFFSRLADRMSEDSFSAGDRGSIMPPLEERMYAGWGK